jgi:5-methylcytosine-specific restriction endonuclease McrA
VDLHRATSRAWKAAHPGRRYPEPPERRREYERQRDREKKRAKDARYRERNRERVNAAQRARYAADPEPTRRGNARRRMWKQGRRNDLTRPQWLAIVASFRGRCAYCGRIPAKVTLDHVLPLARGGEHTARNVVPACRRCNQRKRSGPPLPMGVLPVGLPW